MPRTMWGWVSGLCLPLACVSGVEQGLGGGPIGAVSEQADSGVPDGGAPGCIPGPGANAGTGDLCQGFRPDLGPGVTYRDPSPDGRCPGTTYPSSGTGAVLLEHLGEVASLLFIDRAGRETGIYAPFGPTITGFQVVGLPTGFAILTGGQSADPTFGVDFFSDDGGVLEDAAQPVANEILPFVDGGVLTVRFERLPGTGSCPPNGAVILEAFDSAGHQTGRIDTALGCFFGPPSPDRVVTPTAQGDTLVLLRESVSWAATWLHGPELSIRVLRLPMPGLPLDGTLGGAALADGSVALSVDGRWTFRLAPGSATLEAVPCWLANRPGTRVQLVEGGNAYAVTYGDRDGCDESLEVLTLEGLSCGYARLGPPVAGCGRPSFSSGPAVGRDGTLIRPPFEEDAGAGVPPSCVLRFWPAALGFSGL